MQAEGYTARDAERITGAAYQNLHYWMRSGLVDPSVQRSPGRSSGKPHLFGFRDLVAIRTIQDLRDQEVSLQRIRRVADRLRKARGWDDPLARARLVVVGDDVVLVEAGKVESVLQRPGAAAFAFVLDLERTVREVREAIEREGLAA